MPVRPVRSAAKRVSVFLAMTYSTPNGRNRPRRSCRSDTLRPRYSVSTAISDLPSRSTSPSMAESFSDRARTLLFAKGDSLLSVHEKASDPDESKANCAQRESGHRLGRRLARLALKPLTGAPAVFGYLWMSEIRSQNSDERWL